MAISFISPRKLSLSGSGIQFVSPFKEPGENKISDRVKTMMHKINANWAGVYLPGNNSKLYVEIGRRINKILPNEQEAMDGTLNKPVFLEDSSIYPLDLQELFSGYLLIEKKGLTNDDHSWIELYVELITTELKISRINVPDKKWLKERELNGQKNGASPDSMMAKMVAHDLSSPVNAIKGYLSLIEHDMKSGKKDVQTIKSYYEKITLGVRDISEMVQQFKDYSRLKDDQDTSNPVIVNVAWIVEDICRLKSAELNKREITLVKQIPEQSFYVKADIINLKRVINNLLSNAIKFSEKGSSIDLCLCHKNDVIKIEIQDYGIGIEEDKQKLIFEPFRQILHDGIEKDSGSVGLGLYISSMFTRNMGGRIDLESTPGEGSCFSVVLPAMQQSAILNP